MKHIKKSFFLHQKTDEFNSKIASNLKWKDAESITNDALKKENNSIVFIQTTKNETIGGLIQKISGTHYFFPVPDPTLVYFHNAQISLARVKKVKKELILKLDFAQIKDNIPIHTLYDYYGHSTSVIINLFTALESFLNQQIPSKYTFEKKNNKSTEIFNHQQIMEYIDFKTKLTQIIPEITGKNFMKKPTPTNDVIWNLKQFRDDIIHTKPKNEEPLYQDLMKRSLNFDYDKAILSVAKLMNFYQPNYIIECDCGKDF